MDDRIAVAHGEILTDEQTLNTWAKHRALLIEQGGLLGSGVGLAGGQAFADVDEHVFDLALGAYQFHLVARIGFALVELAALRSERERWAFGLRAIKLDDSGNVRPNRSDGGQEE